MPAFESMTQKYSLDNMSSSLAPAALLEMLGPARFTAEEQAADQWAHRTRVVKDILRVGEWRVGPAEAEGGKPRVWKVDKSTLNKIAAGYNKAHELGMWSSLYWGNTLSAGQHNIVARDAIGQIDQLIVHEDVLYAVTYVNSYQYAELQNPSLQVSLQAAQNYVDGQSRQWDWMLLHVAIVDHAVVDGQRPFVQLAVDTASPAAGTADSEETVDWEASFKDLREIINDILDLMGVQPVEDTIPDDDLAIVLRTKVALLREFAPEDSTSTILGSSEMADAKPTPAATVSMAADTAQQILDAVVKLSNRVEDLEKQRTSVVAAAAFQGKVDSLFAAGKIDAAAKAEYEALGPSINYSLAVLSPLDKLSLAATQGGARVFATGKEPDLGTATVPNPADPAIAMRRPRTDAELEADLAERFPKK